jgi:hypothetical protein
MVFWLRHVGEVWKNSVRAVELAQLLRRVVLGATIPYAFLALALRVLTPLTDARWAPLLVAPSLFVAATVYGANRVGNRRR